MHLFCNSLPVVEWQLPAANYLPISQPVIYRIQASANQVAAQAAKLLTAPELARAERYLRDTDRQRFVVARTALRLILGAYTGQAPAQVRFAAGRNHKPIILGNSGLHFSVSHSLDWVLIALGWHELGVDVEAIRPGRDFLDALRDNFLLEEANHIWRSDDSRQLFFQSWTRKEAFAKATSGGIDEFFASIPSFDGYYHLPGLPGPDWCISSFAVADGYEAALAYQAGPTTQPLFIDLPVGYIAQKLLSLMPA